MGEDWGFSGVGSGVSLTVGRIWPSVGEPPVADRQLALLPVGLLANILPYPLLNPSSNLRGSEGKGKVIVGDKRNHYCHQVGATLVAKGVGTR